MTGSARRFLFLYTDEDVTDRLAVFLRERGRARPDSRTKSSQTEGPGDFLR